jgi:DNA-binding transcriptional LysR family regulator
MLELRQLRQFVAVAEEMSFRRAAARLHMAQPPLTAAIRRIEEELGHVLLERSNRITRLTEAGVTLLDEARRTLAQAERAVTATKRAGAGLTGILRVGFVASAAHRLLPPILRAYRAHHADVELDLREATTAQQIAELRADNLDVGLVVRPIPDTDGLTIETVLEDRLLLALPEDHPLAQRDTVPLALLRDEPWVLFPARQGPGLHNRIMNACVEAGFSPRVVQQAVHMETIVSLVAGGLGVALVPPSLAAIGRKGLAFREVAGAGTPVRYELALAWRTGRNAATLRGFIEVARALAGKDEGMRR